MSFQSSVTVVVGAMCMTESSQYVLAELGQHDMEWTVDIQQTTSTRVSQLHIGVQPATAQTIQRRCHLSVCLSVYLC